MNWEEQFKLMLADAEKRTGVDLEKSKDELAKFMSERSLHLSTITAEPGFDRAVAREAQSVAMAAGLEVSDVSRGMDQRIFGMIAGGLRILAMALV